MIVKTDGSFAALLISPAPEQPPKLVPALAGEGEDREPGGDADQRRHQGQQHRLVHAQLPRQGEDLNTPRRNGILYR